MPCLTCPRITSFARFLFPIASIPNVYKNSDILQMSPNSIRLRIATSENLTYLGEDIAELLS